jgi:drug/metabolite transporter (DMT)-like permease
MISVSGFGSFAVNGFGEDGDSKTTFFSILLLSLAWGYNWVFMKIGAIDAAPLTFAGLRTLLGASCLFLLLFLKHRPIISGRYGELALLGLFNTAIAIGCSHWALVGEAANRTVILVFTMPFWTLLLAWPVLDERLDKLQWWAIGVAGVGLISILKPWELNDQIVYNAVAICGSLSWAIAAIITKLLLKRQPMDLLALTAWQMIFGSLILLGAAFAIQEPATLWTSNFITALIVTGVISTAMGWFLWTHILDKLSAGMAGMTTLLVPIVAITSTSWHLNEPLSTGDIAGTCCVLFGLAVLVFSSLVTPIVGRENP